MQNTCLFYIASQVLKIFEDCTSYKKLHDTTSPFASCCFALVFIDIYISRYDFLQVFRTSLSIIGKNIFVTNSTFLMDSTKPLHPLKSQNPPSVTKVFC